MSVERFATNRRLQDLCSAPERETIHTTYADREIEHVYDENGYVCSRLKSAPSEEDIRSLFKLAAHAQRLEDERAGIKKRFIPKCEREGTKPSLVERVEPREPIERKPRYGVVFKKRAKERAPAEPWGKSSLSGRKTPGGAASPTSDRWKYVSTDRKLPIK